MAENSANNGQNEEYTRENHPNTIEYRRLTSKIAELKQSITQKMDELHFTDEEKQEIMDIIEYHEILKQAAKVPMSKVFEDMTLEELQAKVASNGKQVADNMLKVLNAHMKKIIDRKKAK